MTARIGKVIGRWMGADGSIAEVILDGGDSDIVERFAAVQALPPPRQEQGRCLELDNGERVVLPTPTNVRILPGRKAVAAIFRRETTGHPMQVDAVQAPDNAAIFDADGRLVDVLRNPQGAGSSFVGFSGSSFNPVTGAGEVWIAVRSDDPRDYFLSIYRIDGERHVLEKESGRRIPV